MSLAISIRMTIWSGQQQGQEQHGAQVTQHSFMHPQQLGAYVAPRSGCTSPAARQPRRRRKRKRGSVCSMRLGDWAGPRHKRKEALASLLYVISLFDAEHLHIGRCAAARLCPVQWHASDGQAEQTDLQWHASDGQAEQTDYEHDPKEDEPTSVAVATT